MAPRKPTEKEHLTYIGRLRPVRSMNCTHFSIGLLGRFQKLPSNRTETKSTSLGFMIYYPIAPFLNIACVGTWAGHLRLPSSFLAVQWTRSLFLPTLIQRREQCGKGHPLSPMWSSRWNVWMFQRPKNAWIRWGLVSLLSEMHKHNKNAVDNIWRRDTYWQKRNCF